MTIRAGRPLRSLQLPFDRCFVDHRPHLCDLVANETIKHVLRKADPSAIHIKIKKSSTRSAVEHQPCRDVRGIHHQHIEIETQVGDLCRVTLQHAPVPGEADHLAVVDNVIGDEPVEVRPRSSVQTGQVGPVTDAEIRGGASGRRFRSHNSNHGRNQRLHVCGGSLGEREDNDVVAMAREFAGESSLPICAPPAEACTTATSTRRTTSAAKTDIIGVAKELVIEELPHSGKRSLIRAYPPQCCQTFNGMVFITRFAGGHAGRDTLNGFQAELRHLGVIEKHSKPNHPATCGKVCEDFGLALHPPGLTPAKV
jgi:hypothetical protein